MTNTQWVIPCNVQYYDVVGAFNKFNVIDWKQSKNLSKAKTGDIVYIYISSPVKSIKYQCLIKEVNKPKATIDDSEFVIKGENYTNYGNYMELELLNELNDEKLDFSFLQENGLKGNIQGPFSLKDNLEKYVQDISRNKKTKSNPELENIEYIEGKPYIQYGTKYERNQALRKKAIEIHGTTCKVCGFNFKSKYGELGAGFTEIHHIKPMFSIKQEVSKNPESDLIPLCSNCHKMIHRNPKQPLSIEELRVIVNKDKE